MDTESYQDYMKRVHGIKKKPDGNIGLLILNEIKEQTRKLATGCSKHGFEVVDRTDEVSNTYTARGR